MTREHHLEIGEEIIKHLDMPIEIRKVSVPLLDEAVIDVQTISNMSMSSFWALMSSLDLASFCISMRGLHTLACSELSSCFRIIPIASLSPRIFSIRSVFVAVMAFFNDSIVSHGAMCVY
jgi:hypothetical protein